jgi:hypothetical protein
MNKNLKVETIKMLDIKNTKIKEINMRSTKNKIIDSIKENVLGNERKKIILVLVTKDNEETIEGCLEMASELVDGICVFDIGSKDNTEKLTKEYLKELKIPNKQSKLIHIDNGMNKKNAFIESVKFCKSQKWLVNKTYCLFLNPDEEIYFPEYCNKEELVEDCYKITVKDGTYKTYQDKLFRMDKDWMCKGKVNEYWSCKNTTKTLLDEDKFSIIYVADPSDEDYNNKLLENIKIMENELIKDPNNINYIFHCAEHYFELTEYDKAILLYKKRLEFKNNSEEEFICKLRIAECKVDLVYEEDDIKNTYLEIINEYPFMLEPVFNLMYFYYVIKDWKMAYEIGKLGINIKGDDLPYKYEHKIYDYKYKQKMLKICLNNKNYGLGVKLGLELLKERQFDSDDKDEIKYQYKKCLLNLTNIDLGLDERITNKDDIKVLLLVEDNNNCESTLLFNKITSYGLSVEIISNENSEEENKLKGWYNLNNDDKVSLLDKATLYAFQKKYKYTWFINTDVRFTNDDRLNKLLTYESIDDLITAELSEDNVNMMKKIFEDKLITTISKDTEDWMSTMNNICRLSYSLLGRLNEYRIKNNKLIDNEILLPTLCNKNQEMMISYFSELDLPTKVQRRDKIELNEIEKKVLENTDTYYFNISLYCQYDTETNDIKQYYTLNNSSMKDPVRIFINKDIEFTISDNILIKGLEKKNVFIDRDEDPNNFKNENYYNLKYNKENYICLSSVLKDILENFADSSERLKFLENLLEGEEIVILSGGPSTGSLTPNEVKYITDNYITITVKYALDILLNNNTYPKFNLFNQYVAFGTLEKLTEKAKPFTSIFGSDGSFDDDTALMMIEVNDEHFCIRNFKKLLMNHEDCLTWKEENNKKTYINLHIMCELALPLAIHMGIKKIYTTGWDLKPINNQDYCYTSNIKSYQDSKISEYNYVPNIEKILGNLGISINKIKESPILLNLVDFF